MQLMRLNLLRRKFRLIKAFLGAHVHMSPCRELLPLGTVESRAAPAPLPCSAPLQQPGGSSRLPQVPAPGWQRAQRSGLGPRELGRDVWEQRTAPSYMELHIAAWLSGTGLEQCPVPQHGSKQCWDWGEDAGETRKQCWDQEGDGTGAASLLHELKGQGSSLSLQPLRSAHSGWLPLFAHAWGEPRAEQCRDWRQRALLSQCCSPPSSANCSQSACTHALLHSS